MSNRILTPISVWNEFSYESEISFETIGESVKRGIEYRELFIGGRKVNDDRVKIYAKMINKTDSENAPVIILAQKYADGTDTTFAEDLAKKGYAVLVVDFGGKRDDGQRYTLYPESVSYANYSLERVNCIELEESATECCFYEWTNVFLYAYEFLRRNGVSKIGVIAVEDFANAVWQSSIVIKDLNCAVIISNAGWQGYKGINKFSDVKTPTFSDDAVKFIAGVDSQSYAMHVKFPLYFVSPTNSPEYDVDRAYDTITLIDENVYTALNYSVGNRRSINHKCYKSVLVFLEKMLLAEEKSTLPSETFIKGEVLDGKIVIEVSPDVRGLKTLSLFYAEDTVSPEKRIWQVISDSEISKDGKFVFTHIPFKHSKSAMFFARAEYQDGFRLCSNVLCKKFEPMDTEGEHRYRVLYSSRILDSERFFSSRLENEGKPTGVTISKDGATVKERKGAFDITGLYCKGGLLTFKVGAKMYKPSDGEMMMLDAYIENGGELNVKLIADFYGEPFEYTATLNVNAGVWQNVKLEMGDFKLEGGIPLKTYDKIEAIEINSSEEFIINNVLWV